MPLANYTTGVPVNRSLALITDMLAKAGATSIMTDYVGGEPSALSFKIVRKNGQELAFRLPGQWHNTLLVMNRDAKIPGRFKCNEQAKRVAWRTVHDWVRAQLALVETDNATLDQVMMAYAITLSGETLYERLLAQNFAPLALPPVNRS